MAAVPPRRRARPTRAGVVIVAAAAGDGNKNPWESMKRTAGGVGDKAKGFWDKEVVGAKKAMERRFGDQPGKDVRAELRITLDEAVLGVKKQLTYERECVCAGCDGAGRLSGTFIDCDKCEGGAKRWRPLINRPRTKLRKLMSRCMIRIVRSTVRLQYHTSTNSSVYMM